MSTQKQRTRVIANWYRGSDEFSPLINYRILRAGHIDTAADFRVHRQSVVGHELIFCLRGAGFIRIEDRLYPVSQGHLAWLPVRWPHEHFPDKDAPWEILWLRIDGSKLNNIMQIMDVPQRPVFQFSHPEKVVEIYHHIFARMNSYTLVTDAYCDMLCSQLIFTLLENRSHDAAQSQVITHRGLGKLLYQIHSHYNDEWDIEKFMHYCQVSKSQLFRLFQATFNQSPLKWLKNYRLSQARRLLVETQESISRIAVQVGYNDPLHFSRDFHRAVGLSPSAFRKQEQLEGAHVSRNDMK